MKHIGVLGGTRFIGYHLAGALVAARYRVTLFNRGRTASPLPMPPGVRTTTGDRNRPADLASFLACDYDAVFDLSGFTAEHVAAILDAPRRGRIGHYVFCSTSSVYRQPMSVPCPESADTIVERNTYGGEKRRAEQLLLDTSRARGLSVTILRPTSVFGPHDAAQALPVFARLQNAMPVPIRAGRSGRMTFLFVADVSSVCLRLIERGGRGAVYNLAGSETFDPREFVQRCAAAAGLAARIREVQWPYKRLALPLSWADDDLVLDTTAVRRDLDMEFTPIERGLAATWSWLLGDESRLRVDPARGERYFRQDGRLPWWIKPWLHLREHTSP